MGRILGVFFLPIESAALVAMSPGHDSEIACRESNAGQIPSNRYFIAPDLVGVRSEIPIVLWPGIVDESRLEVRS